MDSEQISHVHFLHEGYSGPRGSVTNLGARAAQKSSFTYYEAALKELDYANFLGKPCLSTVQTLAILSLVHRSFGEVEKEYNLLSVAISTAKLLNMDRLGREHSTMDKMMISTCWVDRETREVGRRLWWTLVICDWYDERQNQSTILLLTGSQDDINTNSIMFDCTRIIYQRALNRR
jgi:signal transduction protein with GAF and PtsI domain